MENVWIFIAENIRSRSDVQLLHAFSEKPLGGDLLTLMGEHAGINLLREFKGQDNFLMESVDEKTEFTIDNFRYTLQNINVD